MPNTAVRKLAFLVSLVSLASLSGASRARAEFAGSEPRLVLWAWERHESLRFVDEQGVAVAALGGSIYLNREPLLRPRMQALNIGLHTPLIAVVRLEVTRETPRQFDSAYVQQVARWIASEATLPQVQALQVDFDATQSQREFYRALLIEVRSRLPRGMALSITALGSWCLGDDWLRGLPIDEAVPMLFRMGVDRQNIVRALEAGDDFREPLCRTSLGVSTDEPWPEIAHGRRVYVFNPRAWTESSFQAVQRRLTP